METENKGVKARIVSAAWQLFHDKGYDHTTVDDIIELSGTSKGSFYYYFNTKDELLSTLSTVLDDYYEELYAGMDQEMDNFEKLLYLNYKVHSMIEEKISIDLLASLYSTQLTARGQRHLLDQNRVYYRLISRVIEDGQKKGQIRQDKSISEITKYYSLCERALISDWCLSKGDYSLGEYSREYMPVMMEHFKA
ncbi:TetR/AcrR family transcriptional regulator [Faecalicatena sp. AGMB00832]|uniref:TetR/AcrR family transcriptional regulator n=1 Tax=Faecalicatena faecalis TaxID=2726362 RepID=A0ABS6D680_9FIRM|nr:MULTISPECIES: TetR/AcrR family transcriptional regulator [Faecalicatena]MBU3877115.1 TetR/AcrR family transcriptional regulator [Faecalicatena faecalis]MCI6467120.1 TetR/AcrR family transcriptional regulator [Faecalicatena sp.]MDY5618904.1 TetR/AcrR family transcriptional regulator [Lachnospiraceae bacterium]